METISGRTNRQNGRATEGADRRSLGTPPNVAAETTRGTETGERYGYEIDHVPDDPERLLGAY